MMTDPLDEDMAPVSGPSPDEDDGGDGTPPWIVPVLIVVILAAVVSIGRNLYVNYVQKPAAMAALEEQERAPGAVGNPAAPVKIEICMGPAYRALMMDLADLAEQFPNRLRAEFHAYLTPDGQAFTREHGRELASVFVNGVGQVVLGEGEAARTVELHGPPGDAYGPADVVLLVRQTLAAGPEGLPEGFDEAVVKFATAGSALAEACEKAPPAP